MVTTRIFFVAMVCSSASCISNATKCGLSSPDIQSPFCLISKQPHDNTLGCPGYELKCSGGNSTTMISFPSYGDLMVKSINYATKRIDLIDPKSCVHEVFLNLDLTNTPFQHFYSLKNYTYLNCSSSSPLDPILRSYNEIPCMSGAGHKVYTVDDSTGVLSNCRAIKTVAIPFGYSPYISDNTFGLALIWDYSPACDGCYNPVANHRQVLGRSIIVLCVLAVAGIIVVKTYPYVQIRGENNKKENEQLLKGKDGKLISQEAQSVMHHHVYKNALNLL